MAYTNKYINAIETKEKGLPIYERAVKLGNKFDTDTMVDAEGVVRWKQTGKVASSDELEFWAHLDKPFNFKKSYEMYLRELNSFFKQRAANMANHKLSDEQKYEMTMAFGKDSTVVDISSGKTFKL